MDTDAVVYEVEQAIMQGADRLAALEVARRALDALTARIAELEARQWQTAKWEDLRDGQGVLVWKYGLWLGGRYDATYDEVDFGEGFTASAREPLLVMPPAPDGDA